MFTNRIRKKFFYFEYLALQPGSIRKHINAVRAFSLTGLLVLLFVITPDKLFCQDSVEVVPDGTEGSTMKIGENPDTTATLGNWYEFDGPFTTLKLGGGLLYDYVAFSQDEASTEQVRLVPDIKLRDFRFMLSGKVKSERFITWKTGLMFDAVENSWLVRETGIMVGVPELSGYIFLGRTKIGYSLSKVMNGYAGWNMERQIALDVIPILADGVKWMGFLPKPRLFWNVGVFADWLSEKQSFSTYAWMFATRAGWLPIYSGDTKPLLHLGVSYMYGEPEDGSIRLRSRPEANPAPYFIDTQVFPANHSNLFGGEIYFSSGSWLFGSEYYFDQFSSAEKDNPLFKGGEVVASYMLTGDPRPYSTVSDIYSFVQVKKSVFDGGPGAWELLLRYSTLDLNGGTVTGGKFWRITPMVNWYLSNNIRLEFNYGYGVLNRYDLEGVTQFFQSRIQFML